jgi:hypothetical protein
MRGISRVLLAMAIVAVGSILVAPASSAKSKAKLEAVTKGQDQILGKRGIKVRVKGAQAGLKLVAKSRTFDTQEFRRLSKRLVLDNGEGTAKLRLSKLGRRQVRKCEARTVKITGQGADAMRFELRRDSKRCAPKPIDLSRAEGCDFITLDEGTGAGDELCMLPFPDDFHTVADSQSATGRRIAFDDAAMPQNSSEVAVAAAPYNDNDGFSPGQTTVVKVPGLDTPEAMSATDPVPLNDLGRYSSKRAPVVVIDTETGERWPIWVEIDSNGETAERTALLIHPAKNYASGHRYVVAMRRLKDAEGDRLEAPEGFRYFRDDLPVSDPAVNGAKGRFKHVFRDLREAEIKRRNLYLAWDFTVSSDENIAARMLHIRDDAFAQLGDTDLDDVAVQGDSPSFAITSVTNFTPAQDPEMGRQTQGTFEVPCYLEPDCGPGGRFELGPDGLPAQNGTYEANFNCGIPHAAVDDPGAAPGRPQVYGHGLLGSASQATSGDQQILGQTHNFVICATDEIGFSSGDVPNIVTNILPDMSNFPELTDRVQQGLLNELFLGRLMLHADGFSSDAAFHVDDTDVGSPPVIDTSRLYYNGNSQGGILGGALTAVAPDFTRASLGVPAMNYSVLLNRSVDFDPFFTLFDAAYGDPVTQQLVLSMIQMLWDRSDPNGYAHRMTSNPLPNTPPHEVLLNVAFGDHQVTTWQADVEARTIGAAAHDPVVFDGRWPGVDPLWGIPRIGSYPYTGSAIVYWDSGPLRANPTPPPAEIGTTAPPIENLPNRPGVDPHGHPRVAPEEMQMVSDFLRPDAQSAITDTCGGLPCFAGGFTGP